MLSAVFFLVSLRLSPGRLHVADRGVGSSATTLPCAAVPIRRRCTVPNYNCETDRLQFGN